MKYILFVLSIIIPTLLFANNNEDAIRIAVLDFGTSGGLTDMEAVTLTNRLRSMLVKTHTFLVLERGKMDEILNEQGFQQTGCTTTECAVEVGRLLNVQKMVSGTIGKLGKTWTMDISLIDIESSQIEKSFFQDYKGEIDELLSVMESVATQISSIAGTKRKVTVEVGKLKVTVVPAEAELLLDNIFVGNSPLILENVVPGKHILQIRATGYVTQNEQIEITKDVPTVLTYNLKKIYTLSVKSIPSGAQVFIDDLQQGMTPFTKKVSEGETINLKISKENYQDWSKIIMVNNDTEIFPKLSYTEAYRKSLIKTYSISINSTPPGAKIMLNNKNIGETPFSSKIREGIRLEIKLQKENYKEWVRNISMSDNVNINAKLEYSEEYKNMLAERAKKQRSADVTEAGTGSGSTWWWIGGGALVTGGAAAILLSSEKEKKAEEQAKPVFPMPPGRP